MRDRLLEVGQRFLRQAWCLAGQGVGPGFAAGALAGELRSGRADGQGRQAGGRAGGTPAGPRRPRGAGGRISGRRGDQGRRGTQPDGRRQSAGDHRTDRGGGGDLPQGRDPAGRAGPTIAEAAAARAVLANCRSRLGWLLHTTGRNDEALSVYRLARADQEALAAAPGATAESRRDLAHTINRVAFMLSNDGQSHRKRRPSSARRWRSTRSWPTRIPPSPSSAANWRAATASSATCCVRRASPSEAEAEYRKALAIQQKLADDNPAVTQFRGFLANHHFGLCILLSDTGKPTEAQAEYRKALAIRKKLADDNPSIPDFQSDLADMLSSIGWRLTQAGKTDEAIGYHTREESIRRKLADASSATPGDRDALANCQTNMADVLRRSGRLDEALAACERPLAVREPLVEAYPDVPWLPRAPGRDIPATRSGAIRHEKRRRSRCRLEACLSAPTMQQSR